LRLLVHQDALRTGEPQAHQADIEVLGAALGGFGGRHRSAGRTSVRPKGTAERRSLPNPCQPANAPALPVAARYTDPPGHIQLQRTSHQAALLRQDSPLGGVAITVRLPLLLQAGPSGTAADGPPPAHADADGVAAPGRLIQ
jgi:hypothetical protein